MNRAETLGSLSVWECRDKNVQIYAFFENNLNKFLCLQQKKFWLCIVPKMVNRESQNESDFENLNWGIEMYAYYDTRPLALAEIALKYQDFRCKEHKQLM